MIKQLKVQKFQSHDSATLDFRPGVNLIVGDSDSGKSALLRALRWLVFNRPSGFTFQSHWAAKGEPTTVQAFFSDGGNAARTRNRKDNWYLLHNLAEPLEAVRTDVPAEVKAVVRLDDLNVQRQGDKPFLLDESPPEVARVLNTVAGLENIDSAHSRIAAKIRENQAVQRLNDSQLLEVNARLEAYTPLPDMQARVAVLARLQGQHKAALDKQALLLELITTVEECQERLKKTEGLEALSKQLVKLEELKQQQEGAVAKAVSFADCIHQAEVLCFRLSALPVESIDALAERLDEVEEMEKGLAPDKARCALLTELGKTARVYTDAIEAAKQEEAVIEEALKAYNVCPECGAEKRYWKQSNA